MEKKQELVVKEDQSPMESASEFLKFGGKMADLEKMLELQERFEANNARKAFHAAMANFKKTPPEILKDKQVSYKTSSGQTEYKHADLGKIATVVGAALAESGLSATWETEQVSGIKVTCTITHELGHSINTSLSSLPDTSGGKNNIQAIGSTITYLQRYTLLALTGIAAADQDDDGAGASTGVTNEIKAAIKALKTVKDTEQYYLDHEKENKGDIKEFIALLAARKEAIVLELSNADS